MSVSLVLAKWEGVEAWGWRKSVCDRMLECVSLYVAERGVSRRSSLSLIFMKSQAYIDYHPVEPFTVWQKSPRAGYCDGKVRCGWVMGERRVFMLL